MKHAILIICLAIAGQPVLCQTLFSYGKHDVSKEEFLKAFNKNNTAGYSNEALKDYLNLYINFKLKVQAARDMKMDTTASQKSDLYNFRQQVIENYLSDDSTIAALCKEALVRGRKDIRVGHIFVPFDNSNSFNSNASYASSNIEDTASAYKKIQEAYKSLQNGNSFSLAALQFSSDPDVKKNQGDIGFITALTLPYAFENILYHLPPGSFSQPYKSSFGYHIFKNIEERPAYGTMKAAQILLPFTPGMTAMEKKSLHERADSIFSALQKGASWNELAQRFSFNNNPSAVNGVIPDITVGKYDPAFEKEVWMLKSDGAITQPFETSFGVHIVKRLSQVPASTDTAQAKTLFRTAVIQNGRLDVMRKSEINKILQRAGYKKVFSNDVLLWQVTDSLLANSNYLPARGFTNETVLFRFDKEAIDMNQWWAHIQSIRNNYRPGTILPYELIMDNFISAVGLTYYQNHLEDFNPAFKAQLAEFEEGNLLFDVMEKKVWSSAAGNESALRKHYAANLSKYYWGPSFTGIYITSEDANEVNHVTTETGHLAKEWRLLGESTSGKIVADSARFELSQLPGVTESAAVGTLYEIKNEPTQPGANNFFYITATHPSREQKSFDEAKGLVINDYQAILEEKWLQKLKKKYRVRVNEKMVKELAAPVK